MAKMKHFVNKVMEKESIDNQVLVQKLERQKIFALLLEKLKKHLLCIIKSMKISSIYPIFKLQTFCVFSLLIKSFKNSKLHATWLKHLF